VYTTYYRRLVISGECSDTSSNVIITVLPSLVNSLLSTNNTICRGGVPDYIEGITPTGGSGSYTFYWEESTDALTWIEAIGSSDIKDYYPGALSVETYYRRIVKSGAYECCIDTSSVLSIFMYDLPIANISGTNDSICSNDLIELQITLSGKSPWNFGYSNGYSPTSGPAIITSPYTLSLNPTSADSVTYDYSLVSVIDDNGCVATDLTGLVTVRVYAVPVSYAGEDDEICAISYDLQAVPSAGIQQHQMPYSHQIKMIQMPQLLLKTLTKKQAIHLPGQKQTMFLVQILMMYLLLSIRIPQLLMQELTRSLIHFLRKQNLMQLSPIH